MKELIEQASAAQLLILIAILFIGVLFFGAIIFFSFNRGSGKRTPMKLGATRPPASPPSAGPSSTGPYRRTRDNLPAPSATEALDTSILRFNTAGLSSEPVDSPENPSINRSEPGFLDKIEETEATMANSVKKDRGDEFNLAARLGVAPPRPASQPEWVELLRLLRDPESGRLVVEVAGKRYTRLADIHDRAVGQYILQLAAHFLAFTNGMMATEAGVKPVTAPKVGEVPLPPSAPAVPAARLAQPVENRPPVQKTAPAEPVAQPPFNAPPSFRPSPPPSIQPPPSEPERRGLLGRTRSAPPPILPALNLADQINEIAQARLSRSPLADTTQLEIVTDPTGGIEIRVNGRAYGSPDDITNPEVKALIKASIKEWEQR